MAPHPLVVATLVLALAGAPALAQDVVTLHSVTVLANNDVTVVYSKNFLTCAHMRFNNSTCTQSGNLTHVNNLFCTMGNQVSVTLPPTAFVAGFGPGIPVFMVHGNNSGVASPCITVGCNGTYGTGCAGTVGTPALDSTDDCPRPGTMFSLSITSALPGSFAVLGLGFGQGSTPLLGCNLLLGSVQTTEFLLLDGSGSAGATYSVPLTITGVQLTTQAYAFDPGGPQSFSATNGLLIRVL
jgi:hypothetical protein